MFDINSSQNIIEVLEKVEHPAIAATLLDLGMLCDHEVAIDGQVSLTLVLPFPSVPTNVRDHLISSLALAAISAGGELAKVDLALMGEDEVQTFLAIEQENWRG
jgi:hypothetical protein